MRIEVYMYNFERIRQRSRSWRKVKGPILYNGKCHLSHKMRHFFAVTRWNHFILGVRIENSKLHPSTKLHLMTSKVKVISRTFIV